MKYTGTLSAPIVRKAPRLLLAEELEGKSELLQQPFKEMMAKVPALFEVHSVDAGDWAGLAMALAREHVLGFKVVNPAGRKTEWHYSDKAEFRYDVDETVKSAPEMAVTDAIRRAMKLAQWAEKTKGMKVSALSKHYYAADLKFLPIIAKARAYESIVRKD